MGPSRRRGRATIKNANERSKRIEDAVSEAMTGDNPTYKMHSERSLLDKFREKLQNTAEESARRYIERKPVQKKRNGGKVRAYANGGCVMSGRGPKFKGQS